MKIITGKSISPGYAQGRAVILGSARLEIPQTKVRPDQIDAELARFHAALEHAYRELEQLQARVQSELGVTSSEIFSAHLLFLKDPQFRDKVEAIIRHDRLSVEAAIEVTADELVHLLSKASAMSVWRKIQTVTARR